ncbi:MAG: DUF3147 family protein [Acidobacteriota bacterium]
MTETLLFRLVLTFFTGLVWIFISISIGKKSGSNLSGFIAGLPSTALLVFFFIGLNQSPEIAAEATTVFPLSYSMTGVFLIVYAKTIKWGLSTAVFSGLFCWFTGGFIISVIKPGNYLLNISIYILLLPVLYTLVKRFTGTKPVSGKNLPSSPRLIFIRSVIGGLIITTAVLLSKICGPIFGGIFSAFPAMFISTLVIAYKTYGRDFSKRMTRPLLLTGMTTIVVYSIGVRYFYQGFGLITGTFFALLLSSLSAVITLVLMQRNIV